jgi:hypothetical protein
MPDLIGPLGEEDDLTLIRVIRGIEEAELDAGRML